MKKIMKKFKKKKMRITNFFITIYNKNDNNKLLYFIINTMKVKLIFSKHVQRTYQT